MKKIKFSVLTKIINHKNYDPSDFSLEFNLAILNEIRKINLLSNQETFKKSFFILPILNFFIIFLYHKNFGKLVRYKFSDYLKFSFLSCCFINLGTIPFIKLYCLNKNLNQTDININNILYSDLNLETKKSLKIKKKILLKNQ